MTDRTYPPGVPCWVDTEQQDVEAAAEFHGDLFGWRFEDAAPPGAPTRYLIARLDGADVAAIAGPGQGDATHVHLRRRRRYRGAAAGVRGLLPGLATRTRQYPARRDCPDLTRQRGRSTATVVRRTRHRSTTPGTQVQLLPGNRRLQLGTLGSGNHFIEISLDEDQHVWLFLHSGWKVSGNKIAQRHIAVAQKLCKQWWINLPDPDLAYLVEDTDEFWAYLRDLRWAQKFALLNREEMMDGVVATLGTHLGAEVQEQERINCHHNFTQRERHFGREVWVSRKGAIEASAGKAGLIPGSMGTASYVVLGKGDPVSLSSSPHGAGRQYSRSKARRTFHVEDLRAAMVGIEYRDTDAFLDEIPAAYKDIDQVMADAADLVEVRHTLPDRQRQGRLNAVARNVPPVSPRVRRGSRDDLGPSRRRMYVAARTIPNRPSGHSCEG